MGVGGDFEEETVLESVIGSPILGKSLIKIERERVDEDRRKQSSVESVDLGKSFGQLLRESTGESFEEMIVNGVNRGIEKAISGKGMVGNDTEIHLNGLGTPAKERERTNKERRDAFFKSLGRGEKVGDVVSVSADRREKLEGVEEKFQAETQFNDGEAIIVPDTEKSHSASTHEKKKKSSKADKPAVETSPVSRPEDRTQGYVLKKKKRRNQKVRKSDLVQHDDDIAVTDISTGKAAEDTKPKHKKKKNRSKKKDRVATSQDIIMEHQTATTAQDSPERSRPKKKKNKKRRISEVANDTDDVFAPLNRFEHATRLERLDHEVARSCLQRFLDESLLSHRAAHENSRPGIQLRDLLHGLDATHLGHDDVHRHEIRLELLVLLDRLLSVLGFPDDRESSLRQDVADHCPHENRVVANQYSAAHPTSLVR